MNSEDRFQRQNPYVVIDSGSYGLRNLGDLAMLQALVQRIQRTAPDATIGVVTVNPGQLDVSCPGAIAIEPLVLGRKRFRRLPYAAQMMLEIACRALLGTRSAWLRKKLGARFFDIDRADYVLASGGGYFADPFWLHGVAVLFLIRSASRRGARVGMVGHGLGPVEKRVFRIVLGAILPSMSVISVREGVMSPGLAESFGAREVAVTGDDATGLLRNLPVPTPHSPAARLGVNIRIANYAGISDEKIAEVGLALGLLAERMGLSFVPLPVAIDTGNGDRESVARLVGGDRLLHDEVEDVEDLVSAARSCSAVVTGSYHAAVFALAQGVPAVCLVSSAYYRAKFAGLVDLYPRLGLMVETKAPDLRGRLGQAVERALAIGHEDRESAHRATRQLIAKGDAVVEQIFGLAGTLKQQSTAEATRP